MRVWRVEKIPVIKRGIRNRVLIMPKIYYTETEFADVVYDHLVRAFDTTDPPALPSKDMTAIGYPDGSVDYAIRGKTVLKTAREKEGFTVLYPKQ